MDKDMVIYNGVPMHPDWPTKIEEAQRLPTYLINGSIYNRIRYGDEAEDWGATEYPCHDCGVAKGQFHVGPVCDVEKCPCCGGQVICCDCEYE